MINNARRRLGALIVVLSFCWQAGVCAQPVPTLLDFWEGRASFQNEQRLRFPGDPYNAECDFYYYAHDSGMAVIEDPNSPGVVYYFLERWKNNNPHFLEPHVYRSTDGGLTFYHYRKICDVVLNGAGVPNSTYAYWNMNGKLYYHFQLREPDVIYYQNAYWIIYEAAAQASSGEMMKGPAIIRLNNLSSLPMTIQHGANMRQHPLMLSYDGDPVKPGLQETSLSTPFWCVDGTSIWTYWAGVHPINSAWERVDTYRGHFSSTPGGAAADCADPMFCFFTPDEHLITNPNLPIGGPGKWDSKNANGLTIVKEDGYYYMMYIGANCPHMSCEGSVWGASMARSTDRKNWVKKDQDGRPSLLDNLDYGGVGVYAKLAKIGGQYVLYFYDVRSLPNPCTHDPVARTYRRTLKWNSVAPTIDSNAFNSATVVADHSTLYTVTLKASDVNGVSDIRDMRLMLHNGQAFTSENGRGYLAWGVTDGDVRQSGETWHIAGNAEGGGRWGWCTDTWGGDTYITPVGCKTWTSGHQRWVEFTLKVKPSWSPAADQKLRGMARDSSNPDGTWVESTTSYSITAAEAEDVGITEALLLADNTLVKISDLIVAAGTAEIGNAFYMQRPDRSAGIRVLASQPVNRGDVVASLGRLGRESTGERILSADFVDIIQSNQQVPAPVFLNHKSLGGTSLGDYTLGVWQGQGLYNVGLLVTVFGRITARGSGYIYIDDGSGLQDGSSNMGVRVDTTGLINPTQTYAIVTGISTIRAVGDNGVRAIRPRTQSDMIGF